MDLRLHKISYDPEGHGKWEPWRVGKELDKFNDMIEAASPGKVDEMMKDRNSYFGKFW